MVRWNLQKMVLQVGKFGRVRKVEMVMFMQQKVLVVFVLLVVQIELSECLLQQVN